MNVLLHRPVSLARASLQIVVVICQLLQIATGSAQQVPAQDAPVQEPSMAEPSSLELLSDELSLQAVRLLQAKCANCHGAEQSEGGLRVDSAEFLNQGGDRGRAVVVGNARESLLYQSLIGQDSDLKMPPKNSLQAEEIKLIERWLNAGSKWPPSMSEGHSTNTSHSTDPSQTIGDAWTDSRNPIRQIFAGQRLDLWSLKPIQQPLLPAVTRSEWCGNDLDRFALARFEAANVLPPIPADPHTLLRRVHFDLTGLPPSAALAAQFERLTEKGAAFERIVDQLLDSPQFGVHWARMWLDVARYSDSNGFDWDEFRPQAWRYRDYVIRSLNQDKPYDQFLREQLAGDEMIAGSPQNASQQDALLATGFLRMGPHDNAAKLFNEQDRSRDELLTDLVETTGSALLGMTLSCCRCHDHKYDPISQADHFRLRACFAGVKFADDLPIDLADEQSTIERLNNELNAQASEFEMQREQIVEGIRQRLDSEADSSESGAANAVNQAEETLRQSTNETLSKKSPPKKSAQKRKPDEVRKAANDQERSRLDELDAAIKQVLQQKRTYTHAMLMIDSEESPPETFVLFQGDYKTPRAKVEPGVFSVINPNQLTTTKLARDKTSGRRTALADWIVSPENPLTARVMANRVWQNLFGQGLVRTPGDFGLAGIEPDDQQLLDWLASKFLKDAWSIKQLIRTIVLSRTYQQAATFGDSNPSVAHVLRRPRRLTAEQIRDSILLVSGLLTEKNSGPPQWPDLPKDVLEANPAFLDDNETKTKGWYPSARAEQHCRSIFLVQKRNTRVPLLETLDQPENSVPCQRRPTSIVAPQALSLLNSPEAIEAAKKFAERVSKSNATAETQIEAAFQLALVRQPTATELAQCQQLLAQSSLVELCRVLLNINEFAYID